MSSVTCKVLPVKTGSADTISFFVEEDDRDEVRRFFLDKDEKTFLSLSLKKWFRRRSLNQNSLWHAMLAEFARQLHVDMSLIKEGLKEVAMTEYGYPGTTNPVTGKRSPLPSHLATVKDFSILFDVTYIEAAEAIPAVDLGKFANDLDKWKEKNLYEEAGRAHESEIESCRRSTGFESRGFHTGTG